jgi:choline dehydrogenase-like flavoprotein
VDVYDVIIVGAGSAGCALAARLSEDPSCSVLLLEAGNHYRNLGDYPPELLHGNSLAASFPGHPDNWSMFGMLTPDLRYPVVRGKVVGGSSAVNGTLFLRAHPSDFEDWSAAGNGEWSWEKVLPYFVKLESDLDFHDDYHGSNGPIPVQRPNQSGLTPVAAAFMEASIASGAIESPDLNAPNASGVGLLPLNFVNGTRMSTALRYIEPNMQRSNLTVKGGCFVKKVLFEGNRAIGVEGRSNNTSSSYFGQMVVLSAGGIKTPQLLQLSGIGPAEKLRQLGIPVIHDASGVGSGFMDHPTIMVSYRTRSRIPPAGNLPISQVQLEVPTNDSGGNVGMQIFPSSYTMDEMMLRLKASKQAAAGAEKRPKSRPVETIRALRQTSFLRLMHEARHRSDLSFACALDMEVSRGELQLASADPEVAPILDYRYMTEPLDLDRMRQCARFASSLLEHKAFQSLGAVRTAPGNKVLSSDQALGQWVRSHLGTGSHLACTARMGSPSDPSAVVDQRCRVYGVEGLCVVDISIMPTLVRRAPNATAIMIGERAADLLR